MSQDFDVAAVLLMRKLKFDRDGRGVELEGIEERGGQPCMHKM